MKRTYDLDKITKKVAEIKEKSTIIHKYEDYAMLDKEKLCDCQDCDEDQFDCDEDQCDYVEEKVEEPIKVETPPERVVLYDNEISELGVKKGKREVLHHKRKNGILKQNQKSKVYKREKIRR